MNRPVKIRIEWGTSDPKKKTYRFKDRRDLRLFLKGVEAAIGWHEYEIIG